jgi:hypothetical protein
MGMAQITFTACRAMVRPTTRTAIHKTLYAIFETAYSVSEIVYGILKTLYAILKTLCGIFEYTQQYVSRAVGGCR